MGTAIKHPVPDRVKPSFVIFDIRALWRSVLSVRVPGCLNYKWRLNPVWHRMLYSCTHMATVGFKRLKLKHLDETLMNWLDFRVWDSKVNVAIRIHISLLSVFTRDSIYAIARMLSPVRPYVCPSVSPSHGCIIEKRLKLVLISCILDTKLPSTSSI